MNNLYVWDRATAKTVRLATAFSFFEWEWLDDDHLVYEASGPKGGRIVVHDFRTQTDATLDVPSGAGLCAAPSFDCVAPGAEAPVPTTTMARSSQRSPLRRVERRERAN